MQDQNRSVLRRRPGSRRGLFCACLFFFAATLSCGDPCEGYFLGHSSLTYQLALNWPHGDGTAQGAWDLTLIPNGYGTNCVDVQLGTYPSETYGYTIEVVQEGEQIGVNIYVDGVLFASGEYEDASPDSELPDKIRYVTGERVDDTRVGGEVTYQIEGEAELEANSRAGSLTWSGYEKIVVLSSRDPDINPGCEFLYDVSGNKVCDE